MKAIKFFTLLVATVLMVACGGGKAKNVAEKIKANEALSESDYTEMINYVGKFAEEAQKIQDQINALPDNSPEAAKLTDKLSGIMDSKPDLTAFVDKIQYCTQQEIGPENVKLINKYAPLQWFTAPDWATIQTSDSIAGFIEQMPASDSSGVIEEGVRVEVK